MKPARFAPRKFPLLAVLALAVLVTATRVAAAADKETVLQRFNSAGVGMVPYGNLIADRAGNLYGTTDTGGNAQCLFGSTCGTVFELVAPKQAGSAWTETILYSFGGGADGDGPVAGLVFDQQGNLYGTTAGGGLYNCLSGSTAIGCGTIFELSPPALPGGAWTETQLYSFTGGADGASPQANLIFDAAGDLYSTTAAGGDLKCSVGLDNNAPGCGTVFELTPPAVKGGAWTESVLYAFHGGTDGAFLVGGSLLLDGKGALYGTTNSGGESSSCLTDFCGSVFKLTPPAAPGGAWTESVLYRFVGLQQNPPDGSNPNGGLVFSRGALYGTLQYGGPFDAGAVFQLAPSKSGGWMETIIHGFGAAGDGFGPWAGVISDSHGNLYGTTQIGGAGDGTVFQLVPPSASGGAWTENLLYSFQGGNDGDLPLSGVTLRGNAIYGVTSAGGRGRCALLGRFGCGVLFVLKPF